MTVINTITLFLIVPATVVLAVAVDVAAVIAWTRRRR
jgi:hypothetical protein